MQAPLDFDVFPAHAQYRPGQTVQLLVQTGFERRDVHTVSVTVLRRQEAVAVFQASLAAGIHELAMDIGCYPAGGYHVEARLQANGHEWAARTAFDVRAHWRETPRYAFLSDFHPTDSHRDIQDFFRRFHLNVTQFYDWMERHDALVPQTATFVDPMGRVHHTAGILSRIQALHDVQSAAIGYAAVYAALQDYAAAHPEQGLYDNHATQLSLIDKFYLMDISDGSPWRQHILDEFAKVIPFGFDGLHLDQYGFPKSARRHDQSVLWMDDAYPSFISACRDRLGDAGLIFNAVSSYPIQTVANAPQDAVYVEVWPPMVRYRHLVELVARTRLLTAGAKQVILAAYLKPFREQRDAHPAAVARSALLVTAVIFASGGYHLVLGEAGGMLTEPYYPDYVPMVAELARPLRAMYDIVTADADLLSGPDVTDVSWSFADGINDAVIVTGAPISVEPEAGKVWVRVTTTRQGLVIQLVNLLWLTHDEWNAIHDEPFAATPPLEVRVEWNHPVQQVLLQTADDGVWRAVAPDWTHHVRGEALHVNVPSFDVWTLIFIPYAADVNH